MAAKQKGANHALARSPPTPSFRLMVHRSRRPALRKRERDSRVAEGTSRPGAHRAPTGMGDHTGGGRSVLEDIRATSDDEYWEDLRRRWTSLLSYRYLGRSHASLNSGPPDPTMKLRYDMRNASGGIMAAPLCIAAPEGGGISDDVGVP